MSPDPARIAAAALGVAVGAGLASPALAEPASPSANHLAAGLDGLALPDRTTDEDPGLVPARPHRAGSTVVVGPGDSLWGITDRLLPGHTDAVTITRTWHVLYEANRARVGDDPDLLLPGTRLLVPRADDLTVNHREDHP